MKNKKIVINTIHGGFSLSATALKRWCALKGRDCFFFKMNFKEEYVPLTVEEADNIGMFSVYTVSNPEEVLPDQSNFYSMSMEERIASNEEYNKYTINCRDIPRDDEDLVKVIKEMKKDANGRFASLKVVSIPGDVDWQIGEYDGLEWVEEKHRRWS